MAIYIFDLDGTLADGEHRVHHILTEPKRWTEYFQACGDDAPIIPVLSLLVALRQAGHLCWIWTGRSDEVAHETCEWLTRHAPLSYTNLSQSLRDGSFVFRMRRAGDHRNDDVLKAEWFDELPPDVKGQIAGVFEDRDRVVAMWRAKGLRCFQVAPGGF